MPRPAATSGRAYAARGASPCRGPSGACGAGGRRRARGVWRDDHGPLVGCGHAPGAFSTPHAGTPAKGRRSAVCRPPGILPVLAAARATRSR